MSGSSSSPETTADSLFDGQLKFLQPLEGYRFSIDALLLAHFPLVREGEIILDLGAGCGVIGLIMLHRNRDKPIHVTALECQEDLALCAEHNRIENHFENRMSILRGSVEQIEEVTTAESFSLVIANPPFYSPGSGRKNTNNERMRARHQIGAGLHGFVAAAARCVANRCRVAFIYPAGQLSELLMTGRQCRLEAKRLRFIYAYPETSSAARLVLVELVKNGRNGVTVEPPYYVYERRNGPYSAAVQMLYHA